MPVCMSVTLVHPPKAVGRNEMLFGRDTRAVRSRGLLPSREGEIRGRNPSQKPQSAAASRGFLATARLSCFMFAGDVELTINWCTSSAKVVLKLSCILLNITPSYPPSPT